MVKIKAIPQIVTETGETGQIVERTIYANETPIPACATLVFIDARDYIVCETPVEAALVQDALNAAA